jgi:formylglycine-generating enzyme required for sulfatase activity
MPIVRFASLVSSSLVLGLVAPAALAGSACPPDSARVGTVCVDRYEASIWRIPVSNKGLLKKVQQGKATVDDLETGGATLVRFYGGTPGDPPDYATNFPGSGDWVPVPGSNPPSPGFYALSLPGVQPALATWYQAQQACALAGKRLLTNEEWQRAAAGTPDPGPGALNPDPQSCKHFFDWPPYDTGSHPKCVSTWGVYDMVGNFGEWVADPVNDWDFGASNQPPMRALVNGIAGARTPDPRYPVGVSGDGIGFRCGR